MSVRQLDPSADPAPRNFPARVARRVIGLPIAMVAVLAFGNALANVAFADTAAPARAAALRTIRVSSVADLVRAVGTAGPGDRIALTDGIYTLGTPVALTASGTAANPVVIAAENIGQATITGAGGFDIRASYLTIEGFVFTNATALQVPASQHNVRLTRDTFQLQQSVKNWVTISGDDCEVDHDAFTMKTTIGVFLMISGPGENGMARNAHVHQNYFKDHLYPGANGGETIRVGLSTRQHASAAAVIEDNVLDNADGDPEAISIKSSDNIVRHNTLLGGRGTITLRHGSRNTVDGNVLIGGSTGIRVFGDDQTVINNVVEDSAREQLIEVGGGEIRTDTDSTSAHDAADRVLVAFNTLVNGPRSTPVLIGGKYPVAPDTITVAHNVLGSANRADSVDQATHVTWQGNVAAAASPGTGAASRTPGTSAVTGPNSA